jgi:addiction module RelE/StbE family toxin
MIEVGFSASFKRAFKRRLKHQADARAKFWKTVEIFVHDPYDERLKTHKLSGQLKDLWSFRVEYDLRVIFYFTDDTKAVFVDIGTHDEVY